MGNCTFSLHDTIWTVVIAKLYMNIPFRFIAPQQHITAAQNTLCTVNSLYSSPAMCFVNRTKYQQCLPVFWHSCIQASTITNLSNQKNATRQFLHYPAGGSTGHCKAIVCLSHSTFQTDSAMTKTFRHDYQIITWSAGNTIMFAGWLRYLNTPAKYIMTFYSFNCCRPKNVKKSKMYNQVIYCSFSTRSHIVIHFSLSLSMSPLYSLFNITIHVLYLAIIKLKTLRQNQSLCCMHFSAQQFNVLSHCLTNTFITNKYSI